MNAAIHAVAKRYRYTGKERDEKSGLARYYIPWLCRWSAVDSSETKNAPKSSYGYCLNNPVSKFDPDELLVLKLARGGSWLGRLGNDTIMPERLVRVIPEQYAGSLTLGAPGSIDVFVTTASELKGLRSSKEIAKKLTLVNSEGKLIQGPFRLIEFDAPATGLAQPIRRTNSGFIHGGRTAGGAIEYVMPNYKISELQNVIQRTVK